MQTDKTIRIAVVGTGYLGKFHAEKYAHMPNVDLVGVVDTDIQRARDVAQQLGTRAYRHHADLFDHIDAASIVVPTSHHYTISKDYLSRQIDVLIEKPITTTLKEADELIEMAGAHRAIIQVGHLERFNPAVVALRDYINQPMFIESHRLSVFKPRATDVSVVLDLMIHDVDIIANFVRSDIKDIRAAGIAVVTEEVDIANARLEFENGCVANVTASRISMKNQRKIRLFQRDAYISVDFANHEITRITKDETDHNGLIPGMEIDQMSFQKGDALDDELKAFIESVRRRRSPEVDGLVGREALRIALEIMQQIKRTSNWYTND